MLDPVQRYKIEVVEPSGRIGAQCMEDRPEIVRQVCDRRFVPQVGGEVDRQMKTVVLVVEAEREVQCAALWLSGEPLDLHPLKGHGDLVALPRLQTHRVLEQRMPIRAPRRLGNGHDLFEGVVLVLVHPQSPFFHRRDKLGEGLIGCHVRAVRHLVDEQSDHIAAVGMVSPRGGTADEEVVASGRSCHSRLESGEQQHVQGHPVFTGGGLHLRGLLRAEVPPDPCCASRRDVGTRQVCGKREVVGQVGRLFGPEVPRRHVDAFGQTLPFPSGDVTVGGAEFGERRALPADVGVVGVGDFAQENLTRPAVKGHVVNADKKYVILAAQPKQLKTCPTGPEVERGGGLVGRSLFCQFLCTRVRVM